MVAPTATALRDGQEVEIPARDLVPGDMVLLAARRQSPCGLPLEEIEEVIGPLVLSTPTDALRCRPGDCPGIMHHARRSCSSVLTATISERIASACCASRNLRIRSVLPPGIPFRNRGLAKGGGKSVHGPPTTRRTEPRRDRCLHSSGVRSRSGDCRSAARRAACTVDTNP